VVVANAGIGLGGLFADSDPAAFDRVIGVNLLGPVSATSPLDPAVERIAAGIGRSTRRRGFARCSGCRAGRCPPG
jgi:NAD(P)-dependent dehydrogenase (short-subunit alcohol dehydrogenase family)